MKIYTLTTLTVLICIVNAHAQDKELNVIYGDHHIFTIETPTNWINDIEAAQSIGLTNFFYCADDVDKAQRSHMYANGIDKTSESDNLDSFLEGDIAVFKEKYPDAEYSIMEGKHSPPIINSIALSFENLHDRYKEEVVYLETNETIILLCFSTYNKKDYKKYVDAFYQEFAGSFVYRGNDPSPFLEWQKKQNE